MFIEAPGAWICPVDIAFIVDTSSTIWIEDFKQQINFIHDIVKILDIGLGPKQSRVAIVSYSNNLQVETDFSYNHNRRDVLKVIDKIEHAHGDATRTYLALEYVHDTIFAPGKGERPEVTNVVIVLTDGVTNAATYDPYTEEEGRKQTQIQANRLKALPASVFAIGIGNKVDRDEIIGIASKPSDTYSFFVKSYGKLNTGLIKNAVMRTLCFDRKCILNANTVLIYFLLFCNHQVSNIYRLVQFCLTIMILITSNINIHLV